MCTEQSGLHTVLLKRHEDGGAAIKIACGTKTFMLNVTFIKTMGKKASEKKSKETVTNGSENKGIKRIRKELYT